MAGLKVDEKAAKRVVRKANEKAGSLAFALVEPRAGSSAVMKDARLAVSMAA